MLLGLHSRGEVETKLDWSWRICFELVLVLDGRPQFPSTWVSSQGCRNVLTKQQLPLLRTSDRSRHSLPRKPPINSHLTMKSKSFTTAYKALLDLPLILIFFSLFKEQCTDLKCTVRWVLTNAHTHVTTPIRIQKIFLHCRKRSRPLLQWPALLPTSHRYRRGNRCILILKVLQQFKTTINRTKDA